ncbi:MAG: rhodanese-like domain-containing protein [Candidatus Latescibacter sp.]|nr:rhodanese-like domain-containing protein [Candidatus Latescibacter sp.]
MRTKRLVYYFLSLIFVLFFFGCANLSTIPLEMEPVQVSKMLETDSKHLNLVILDVRTSKEFDQSHIGKAINIDFYSPTLKKDLRKLDRTKSYLVYCRSGNRSMQALKIMRELGFGKVASITGGIIKWQSAGLRTLTTEMEQETQ